MSIKTNIQRIPAVSVNWGFDEQCKKGRNKRSRILTGTKGSCRGGSRKQSDRNGTCPGLFAEAQTTKKRSDSRFPDESARLKFETSLQWRVAEVLLYQQQDRIELFFVFIISHKTRTEENT